MLKKLKRLDWLLLIFLMALGAFLRTYRINTPLADWHSWRQSDTASVAREYARNGIDLLHPRYQDISSIPSGQPNPQGYRFVEFPIINALHAKLFLLFPQISLVVWGRILTIAATTLTIALIYFLAHKLQGTKLAFFSAFFFAAFPYNLFYGRAILPEPFMVLFMLAALYFTLNWLDKPKIPTYLFSLLFFSLALLMKPTSLIIILPIAGYALSRLKNLKTKNIILLLLLPLISLFPYLWWRNWMKTFPSGIPYNRWLFNSNNIRFKGAWFRWLFGERIAKLILGYWGLIPVGLGLFALDLKKDESRVITGLILGALAYLSIIATGNVQHDYYQIQIIPALAFLFGLGATWAIENFKKLQRLQAIAILTFSTLLGLALSWYEIRGYFNINNPAVIKAGKKVQQLTPKNALVIAPYQGDTAFLFQTNRRGWAVKDNIQDKIQKGANYYVTTAKDEKFQELKSTYQLIYEEPDFAIIKLKQDESGSK